MEHTKIKNGSTVKISAPGAVYDGEVGVVKSFNPAGNGIFTVKTANSGNRVLYFYENELEVLEPGVEMNTKLVRAMEKILESATKNQPFTVSGGFILADGHAGRFNSDVHLALLELLGED